MKSISLRTLVSVIGMLVAATTAVSVPLGYFVVGYTNTASLFDFKADLNARYLAKYIYTHNTLWQYQRVRLAELLDQTNGGKDSRKRVVDSAGKLVFDEGSELASPVLTRSAPIEVAGSTVGRVEISTSLRPLVYETGFVAILSTMLGLGMFFAVRVFPLRVLDQTLGTLERTNDRFDAALNNMSQGLCMFDSAERLVVCNDRYIEMYDLSRDIVKPGCTLSELFKHRAERGHLARDPDQYRTNLLADLSSGKTTNWIVETGDGREISITNCPMQNGGWVATHEDITERRAAQAKISHMALHDALTNLPNRLYFREQLENRFAHPERDKKFAVLCFDLDRFKSVNDALGHAFGDELLTNANHLVILVEDLLVERREAHRVVALLFLLQLDVHADRVADLRRREEAHLLHAVEGDDRARAASGSGRQRRTARAFRARSARRRSSSTPTRHRRAADTCPTSARRS